MTEPKQDRAVRKRAAILRAAAGVFDEYGFSGASISRIMDRAGSTQGGLYFHFKSKENLAQAVMAGQREDLLMPSGEDGLQHLIDITLYISYELQHNVLLRAGVRLAVEQGSFGLQDDRAYRDWVGQFVVQLVAARRRGELLPGVDEEEYATVLVSAYSGTQLFSQVSTGRADLPRRIEAMWRYLLPGIASAEVRSGLRIDAARFAVRA
ncbi:ScbR family autoregulator-binding transcription factor [Kitasatospora sp. NPDC057223]|uniref:ScbR family autoregulator-binding transcription factor n=1 Tax=Kitasatospora sp. NPDC057223 TaxID=3346055 RepID=UPI0036312057